MFAAAASEAARGQVIYITEHRNRVAGIVPMELAAILDRLTTDQLDQLAAAAELAGLASAAVLMEDLADRAGVLESRAEPGTGVPWEQLEAEASMNYRVTWSEKASTTRGYFTGSVFKFPPRTPKPVRFPQNRHRLNTRRAAGPHGRPRPRPSSRLLSGKQLWHRLPDERVKRPGPRS